MSLSRNRAVPAHGTTRNLPRTTQGDLSALGLLAVSPIEEAFFRAGDAISEGQDVAELDDGPPPPTLWRAILSWLRG